MGVNYYKYRYTIYNIVHLSFNNTERYLATSWLISLGINNVINSFLFIVIILNQCEMNKSYWN